MLKPAFKLFGVVPAVGIVVRVQKPVFELALAKPWSPLSKFIVFNTTKAPDGFCTDKILLESREVLLETEISEMVASITAPGLAFEAKLTVNQM